ncbi:MAG TPA: hypothetical protein VMV86_01515 [Methanosarcinales archaeon]|nr:hypothetical protein [Methanosarcinales archaeon]
MITLLETIDSVYSFTPDNNVSFGIVDKFVTENNNKKSDTQGFMRKIQVGDTRIKCQATFTGTKSQIENNIYPMLTYPFSVNITFDRNIPTKTVATMNAVIEDYELSQEFKDGDEQEISIVFTEVLT